MAPTLLGTSLSRFHLVFNKGKRNTFWSAFLIIADYMLPLKYNCQWSIVWQGNFPFENSKYFEKKKRICPPKIFIDFTAVSLGWSTRNKVGNQAIRKKHCKCPCVQQMTKGTPGPSALRETRYSNRLNTKVLKASCTIEDTYFYKGGQNAAREFYV